MSLVVDVVITLSTLAFAVASIYRWPVTKEIKQRERENIIVL